MARAPISPELALVDPTLALSDIKEAWPVNSLDPTNMSPPPGNGSAAVAAAETSPVPSIEALLFNAGAISADQLGELVRDAVLTQRPVTAIVLERGLATPEMLAALQAGVGIDFSPPAPSGDASASSPVEVAQEAAFSFAIPPPRVEPEPVAAVVSQLETPMAPTAVTDPQAFAAEPVPGPATTFQQPEPLRSLDERVQAAVARAAQPPPQGPAPVAADAPMVESTEGEPAATMSTFTIVVRLQTGERLAADTAATFENAAEVARALAGKFARAGEWPLIAGRCIRPDAIVSVDIERPLAR